VIEDSKDSIKENDTSNDISVKNQNTESTTSSPSKSQKVEPETSVNSNKRKRSLTKELIEKNTRRSPAPSSFLENKTKDTNTSSPEGKRIKLEEVIYIYIYKIKFYFNQIKIKINF